MTDARVRTAGPVVGRLAPTPSGQLHLGNVCAFAAAWLSVRSQGGRILLRIEDVDGPRSRVDIADGIRRDLAWLGLDWDAETTPQSLRDYTPWLARLGDRVYRCGCSRASIQAEGGVYPGTCRHRGLSEGASRFALPEGVAIVHDRARGAVAIDRATMGDPVLRRRDGVYAYNLAVVVDDIEDGVTEVVRGADLLEQTAVQAALWRSLGAHPPTWLHAPLILGDDGRKLSKSHGSTTVGALRGDGWEPADVWRVVLPWLGVEAVASIAAAVTAFSSSTIPRGPFVWRPQPLAQQRSHL